MDFLNKLDDLLENKRLELKDGIFLEVKDEINIEIKRVGGITYINFGAPLVRVHIKKLGIVPLSNLLKPRLERIEVREKTVKIVLDGMMDFEVDKDELIW